MASAALMASAPGMAQRLGQRARTTALSLDWRRIVLGIEDQYREALRFRQTVRSPLRSAYPAV